MTSLVKTIDKQLEEAPLSPNQRKSGIYIIFCNDDPTQTQRLKAWIADEQLKHVVVCKDSAAGPSAYKVNKEADLTAIMYFRGGVKTNIALREGELDECRSAEITKAVGELLPKKK